MTELLSRAIRLLERALGGRSCRVCGCTEHAACADGCYWTERHLCSRCNGELFIEGIGH